VEQITPSCRTDPRPTGCLCSCSLVATGWSWWKSQQISQAFPLAWGISSSWGWGMDSGHNVKIASSEKVKISPMCKVNATSRKSGVWIPNQSPIRGLRL
jgi:hypothetical protein